MIYHSLLGITGAQAATIHENIVRISHETVDTLKTISLVFSLFLGVIFLIISAKYRALTRGEKPSLEDEMNPPEPAPSGVFQARWDEILRHMESAKEAEWKFAVIEADKLVDLVLARAGFSGDTLGDRLMRIQEGQLQNLQHLWDAHKIRNHLAHDVDYFLRYTEAKQAIDRFEAVLRELGAL